MPTLRFKRKMLNNLLIYLILLIFGFFLCAYQLISSLVSFQQLSYLSLGLMILLGALAVWLRNAIFVARSYRIEFHETFFEVQVIISRLSAFRPFKCAYADIVRVRKMEAGQIEIVPRAGKALILIPGVFEGGEKQVFDLLAQYIPAERIEMDLRKNYKKQDSIARILSWFSLLMAVAMLFQSPLGLLPLPLGWNYAAPWTIPGLILGVSSESSGSVWVTGPELFKNGHILQHIMDDKTVTWPLPAEVDFGDKRILVDSHQQPVLITNHELYFLQDGKWQKQNFETGGRSFIHPIHDRAVVDNEYWVPYYDAMLEQDAMMLLQADAPHQQKVTLLNPVTQKSLIPNQIQIAADGTSLLLDDVTIYLLRHGEVQKQLYPVALKEGTRILDFALADDGSVYVLLSTYAGSGNFVEKIGTDGTQTFTKLPALLQDDSHKLYRSLEVDSRGRLWLAGYYSPTFVKVLEPVWGASAQELVQYDQNNSNYDNGGSHNLLRTSDGRMWAGSYRLIWMDGNAAQLPAPLPDWLAQIRRVGIWIVLPFQLLASIALLLRMRKKKPHLN